MLEQTIIRITYDMCNEIKNIFTNNNYASVFT
jgi:hypothetical protein